VLLEKPNPGRAAAVLAFFGEFGLAGSVSNNFCCVASSVAMILEMYKL
jgi:hypothetical protein